MDRRRMCPNCRAFISTDDRKCQYCDIALKSPAQSRLPTGEALGGLIPEHAFTTFILLVINAAMWTISILLSQQAGNTNALMDIDGQTLVLLGAKYTPLIRGAGQWWRLITAGFLHGGAMHILMNSWAMLRLGADVESEFGAARYLLVYFAGTVGGFWMSMVLSPNSLSVGASAGLCGLVGAMIAIGFLSRSRSAREMRQDYLRYAGFTLVFGVLSSWSGWRIDNWAHAGGVIGGFGAAMIVGLPRPVQVLRERFWTLAAWGCVLLTIFSFVQMLAFYTRMHHAPALPQARPPVVRELPRERL